MNNVLIALPTLLVTGGVALPLLVLDGKGQYVDFLWHHPNLVALAGGAWGVLFYWLTRRTAAVLLLRNTGAKLRVGDVGTVPPS
jgi:hypothetical protein